MHRRSRHRRLLPLGLSYVLALSGSAFAADAGAGDAPYEYHEMKVLGTSLDLQVVAPSAADADRAHDAVMKEIERLRSILSTYDTTSDMGKVNASRGPIKVSKEVIDLLKEYDHWQTASRGAFSGRLGSVIAMWKAAAKAGQQPTREEVRKTIDVARDPLWKIDEQAGTVQRLGDRTINIDSLGKGFIVSRAAHYGRDAVPSVRGLLLNIGGDIAALGSSSPTKIEEWKVGIADPAHPADNAEPLATVKLSGMSIATSGSYERSYAFGDLKLSHIIDPRVGYPINSPELLLTRHEPLVASATVIARDNGVANALAASLCVLPPTEGLSLIAATPGAEALMVFADGKQLRTPGFSRYEVLSDAVARKGWANGAEVGFSLQYNVNGRERPYVAVWVEDAKGQYVTTLAEWGNGRWMNSLSTWYRFTWQYPQLPGTVSRATRPAGRYSFVWDGKDQKGNVMPAGIYKVCVELAYEHSGHSVSAGTIVCGDKPATATIAGTRHYADLALNFGPRGNAE